MEELQQVLMSLQTTLSSSSPSYMFLLISQLLIMDRGSSAKITSQQNSLQKNWSVSFTQAFQELEITLRVRNESYFTSATNEAAMWSDDEPSQVLSHHLSDVLFHPMRIFTVLHHSLGSSLCSSSSWGSSLCFSTD